MSEETGVMEKAVSCHPAIADMPPDSRPRERLLSCGAASLGTVELLALLIRTGTPSRNAIELATDLLALFPLRTLGRAGPHDIARVEGLGPAKGCLLAAAFELGRRAAAEEARMGMGEEVTTPGAAAAILAPLLAARREEAVAVLYLNRKKRLISSRLLTTGGPDASILDPRQLLREALLEGAAAVLLAHNHPTGDPTPSREDVEVTKRAAEAARAVGIELADHIVLGGGGRWVSLRESGKMP